VSSKKAENNHKKLKEQNFAVYYFHKLHNTPRSQNKKREKNKPSFPVETKGSVLYG